RGREDVRGAVMEGRRYDGAGVDGSLLSGTRRREAEVRSAAAGAVAIREEFEPPAMGPVNSFRRCIAPTASFVRAIGVLRSGDCSIALGTYSYSPARQGGGNRAKLETYGRRDRRHSSAPCSSG